MSITEHRYLIDSDDLIAGLGHLVAAFNIPLKIALRHNLTLVPGLPGPPLVTRLRSRIAAALRAPRQRRRAEAPQHEGRLNDYYDDLLRLRDRSPIGIDGIMEYVKSGRLTIVDLPAIPRAQTPEILDDERYCDIDTVVRSHPGPGIVFRLPGPRLSNCDGNFDATRATIQRMYWSARRSHAYPDPFHPGELRVAVNIRRGDIVASDRYRHRILSDNYYCAIIDRIATSLSSQPVHVIIFSDGNCRGSYINELGHPVDWRRHPLLRPRSNLTVDVNLDYTNWLSTLHALVTSDVLVTSRSAFSNLAAVLRDGLTIAPPVQPPLPRDCSVIYTSLPDGTLGPQALTDALRSYLEPAR